jgi:hypothetical protein
MLQKLVPTQKGHQREGAKGKEAVEYRESMVCCVRRNDDLLRVLCLRLARRRSRCGATSKAGLTQASFIEFSDASAAHTKETADFFLYLWHKTGRRAHSLSLCFAAISWQRARLLITLITLLYASTFAIWSILLHEHKSISKFQRNIIIRINKSLKQDCWLSNYL